MPNWSAPGGPIPSNDVFIDPVNGLTVNGPNTYTQVTSLTLGAQRSGFIHLIVDAAGDLLIDQTLTVQADGKLSGSGNVTAVGGITNQGEIDLGNGGLNLAGGTLTNTDLIRGGGSIDNPLVNSAGGEVSVAAGRQMHLSDTGAQSNAGRIEVIGTSAQFAEIRFDGLLTNLVSTGNIAASNALLRFSGGLTNQGNVGISFGTSNVFGDIDNQLGASMTVTGNSNVTFWDDLNNDGTVEVSTAVYFAGVTIPGTGSFPGGGTNIFHADLAPGSSPDKVDFGGNVVFGASAQLESELAGTAPGSEHVQLDIVGSVSLDGTLDLVPLAPYTGPASSGTADEFVIITAGSRSGTFATVHFAGSPLTADFGPDGDGSFRDHVGGGLFRSLTYTATTVQLRNLATPTVIRTVRAKVSRLFQKNNHPCDTSDIWSIAPDAGRRSVSQV